MLRLPKNFQKKLKSLKDKYNFNFRDMLKMSILFIKYFGEYGASIDPKLKEIRENKKECANLYAYTLLNDEFMVEYIKQNEFFVMQLLTNAVIYSGFTAGWEDFFFRLRKMPISEIDKILSNFLKWVYPDEEKSKEY